MSGRPWPGSPISRRRFAQLAAAAGIASALRWPPPANAATQSYDDGTDAIPGGVEGAPERVIVIGAGFAGLTAANALRNAGVDVVVVEGRRRIGGRARTADVGGAPIDLGCSWIHDPIGNPMARFAEQAGVGRSSADIELDLPRIRFFDEVSGGEVPLPQVVEAFGHTVTFGEQAPGIAEELGPDSSVREGAELYLRRQGLEGAARRRAEFALRLFAEQEENTYWDRISLPYYANYTSPYDGVGQGDFPVGGYRGLIAAMAAGTEIELGHRVREIERTAVGVRVTCSAGGRHRVLRGSHALVTVPLGVLKHGDLRFSPGLPAQKRGAIDRLGFGRFEKVAMLFDEPFWEQALKTHIVHLSAAYGLDFPLTLDLQRLSGFPALVALYAGRPVRRLHGLEPEQRLAKVLGVLETVLGQAVPAPVAYAATDWRRDPFARGAYTTILHGQSRTDLDRLATPLGGRLLFAGEATSHERLGYADGAMSTGIREAKRLLRSASVELSAG